MLLCLFVCFSLVFMLLYLFHSPCRDKVRQEHEEIVATLNQRMAEKARYGTLLYIFNILYCDICYISFATAAECRIKQVLTFAAPVLMQYTVYKTAIIRSVLM